jgi:signal transduction histidine kinase
MPYSLSAALSPRQNEQLAGVAGDAPPWTRLAGTAGAIGVVTIAVLTYLGAFGVVDRPLVLGLLLAAGVSPFLVQLWWAPSPAVVAVWALVPLGALNVFGSALGATDPHGRDQSSLMIVVWLVGQTASIGRRRDIVAVTAAALGITVGRFVVDDNFGSGVVWSFGVGIALLAGLFIRTLVVALVNEKLAQEVLNEQATTAERQRIAREVHDVIAHSLTVTMLHLTAARLAVARGDSVSATEALEEAERAGRSSLGEIRRTVGLLSTNGNGSSDPPQPSASDVPALVAGYQAAGVQVDLEIHGDVADVDPTVGLAIYRIVQESLANAAKHAPGARASVQVELSDPVAVEVRTNGSPPALVGAGMGLIGMRERAAALGGSCVAGPEASGWNVSARLPLLPPVPPSTGRRC